MTGVHGVGALLLCVAALAGCDRSPPPTAIEEARIGYAMAKVNAEQDRTDRIAEAERAAADAVRQKARDADDKARATR